MLVFVLSGVLGYLIGSIPTAFLVVRWKSSVDIRRAGSGNVGALNSFEVTRSKLVLFLDLLKGVLATLVAAWMFGHQFSIQATGGVAAVTGHNFPIWLKFKGGRGLATAAGVMFVVCWVAVFVWGVLWAIGFALTRDVNAGNTIASLVEMSGFLLMPATGASLCGSEPLPIGELRVFALVLFLVILSRHLEPMREYLNHSTKRR